MIPRFSGTFSRFPTFSTIKISDIILSYIINVCNINGTLRSKKTGRFEKLLGFGRSHSIVTHNSVSLSCATTPQPSCFSTS